ncbi:2-hydroxyacyl-CoA dehydratase [Paenibacillus turpanensis]|uniref:2-hydroxyacyl-CoA dehydratase n=1 Tax=Paenibacillus turpanensis TaxID=2689078 RepID=UPI0014077AFC|nr:2-hydroxyacyl-CoA dehydratase [Paenibacillus turpanensis]
MHHHFDFLNRAAIFDELSAAVAWQLRKTIDHLQQGIHFNFSAHKLKRRRTEKQALDHLFSRIENLLQALMDEGDEAAGKMAARVRKLETAYELRDLLEALEKEMELFIRNMGYEQLTAIFVERVNYMQALLRELLALFATSPSRISKGVAFVD